MLPTSKLRLDAGKCPASQCAAQSGMEGGAATLHPPPAQSRENRCHSGGPGDIASRVSKEPDCERGMQGKLSAEPR